MNPSLLSKDKEKRRLVKQEQQRKLPMQEQKNRQDHRVPIQVHHRNLQLFLPTLFIPLVLRLPLKK